MKHYEIKLTANEIEWLRWELEDKPIETHEANRIAIKLAIVREEPMDDVVARTWGVDLETGLTYRDETS